MSFVATPVPPSSPPSSVVPGDGFWPDIDVAAMRDALALGPGVPHARLLGAIEGGLLAVEGQLAEWRARAESAGATSLDQVEPDRTIAGEVRAVVLWTRAVRFAAAAEIADLHTEMSATGHGAAAAPEKRLTAADYRRLSTEAVRDLLGTSRCTVELI
ncbi:head completion/stabilization protein [Novosphingobium huizhouense]|uniref:head completion/stabilization protein n=1 Tax=Novosphingobium huizhouense TaxID=2866625 RepID=UPI001CD90D53|nr:head completion/stabilization protein [Novosphingobium huizhouense]